MAEQQLDGANVGARFQQVNREGVTQRMRRDRFRDFANTVGFTTGTLNRKSADVLLNSLLVVEEPGSLSSRSPRHRFVLPVRTHTLVFWPMLYGWIVAGTLWLVTAGLIYRSSGFQTPLLLPALGLAADGLDSGFFVVADPQHLAAGCDDYRGTRGYGRLARLAGLFGLDFNLDCRHRAASFTARWLIRWGSSPSRVTVGANSGRSGQQGPAAKETPPRSRCPLGGDLSVPRGGPILVRVEMPRACTAGHRRSAFIPAYVSRHQCVIRVRTSSECDPLPVHSDVLDTLSCLLRRFGGPWYRSDGTDVWGQLTSIPRVRSNQANDERRTGRRKVSNRVCECLANLGVAASMAMLWVVLAGNVLGLVTLLRALFQPYANSKGLALIVLGVVLLPALTWKQLTGGFACILSGRLWIANGVGLAYLPVSVGLIAAGLFFVNHPEDLPRLFAVLPYLVVCVAILKGTVAIVTFRLALHRGLITWTTVGRVLLIWLALSACGFACVLLVSSTNPLAISTPIILLSILAFMPLSRFAVCSAGVRLEPAPVGCRFISRSLKNS